jgi:hypothetical protein
LNGSAWRHEIVVRNGKGAKDRIVMLPRGIENDVRAAVEHARVVHQRDLAAGFGAVYLPGALMRKYPDGP